MPCVVDAGGDVEQQRALAQAGVTVEDNDLAERQPIGNEPLDPLAFDRAVAASVSYGFRFLAGEFGRRPGDAVGVAARAEHGAGLARRSDGVVHLVAQLLLGPGRLAAGATGGGASTLGDSGRSR